MPINVPFQNDVNTSLYIVDLSNKTGKTYRELKALWDKFYNEVQFDVMYNPTKYATFAKGDIYEETGKRLEKYVQPDIEENNENQNKEETPTNEQTIPENAPISAENEQTISENEPPATENEEITSETEPETISQEPEEKYIENNNENNSDNANEQNNETELNDTEVNDQMNQVPTDKELTDMLSTLKL